MKFIFHFIFITALSLLLISPLTVKAAEIINEVFLLEKEDKLLAFSGLRNNWFEKDLRAGEKVVKSMYDGNVAVAYTNERALAFSVLTSRWAEERFRIRESVISITADGNIGTIITNLRALGFSAKSGVWVESLFNIGK